MAHDNLNLYTTDMNEFMQFDYSFRINNWSATSMDVLYTMHGLVAKCFSLGILFYYVGASFHTTFYVSLWHRFIKGSLVLQDTSCTSNRLSEAITIVVPVGDL